MPDIPKATSQVIDDRRVAMAEAIVARQYALRPDLEQYYGPAGIGDGTGLAPRGRALRLGPAGHGRLCGRKRWVSAAKFR
jgi:hypothetical protein